jgi:hypothetical protein
MPVSAVRQSRIPQTIRPTGLFPNPKCRQNRFKAVGIAAIAALRARTAARDIFARFKQSLMR